MKIADIADIRFECPHCGQPFVVEACGAGLETSCPICETKVVVPQTGPFDYRDYGNTTAERNRLAEGARTARPDSANPDTAGLREDLIETSLRAGRVERELDEAQAENDALRQQLKAANGVSGNAEFKTFKADRAQLKAELAAVKQRLANAEVQLTESRARAADLQSGLAMANNELASALGALDERSAAIESNRQQLSLDLDVAHEKLRAVVVELAIRDRESKDTQARATALEEQLTHAKSEISVLQDESGLYRRNFDEAQSRLAESAKTGLELANTTNELQATHEKLRSAEDGCKSLAICCEELRKESDGLRRDLQGSKKGRELLELRTRFKATQEEHRVASRTLGQVEDEVHRLATAERQLRSDLDEARRSNADAERRAEAGSESKLSKDNFVLRGIIERQNGELVQRLYDLNRLRRMQLWVRLTYALLAIALLGVVALALRVIPLAFK